MLNRIYTIINSSNPNLYFLRLLITIAIVYFVVTITNRYLPKHTAEGFSQDEPYVYKENNDAVDTFYTSIYDTLHSTETRSQAELIKIIKMTNPSTKNSTLLDVGSGTGYIVNQLNNAGYNAYGIDNSHEMIESANNLYPDTDYIYGDVMNSMQFEKGTFTHILCTYFTIYQIKDKKLFFRNCYHWMKPNSYLILHLVDTDTFTNMIPHVETHKEEVKKNTSRKLQSWATFTDYKYKCTCDIPSDNDNNKTEIKETFVDIETNNTRQNGFSLYMEKMNTILGIASNNGFIKHGKVDMKGCNGDKNQYLYILERPL